MSRVALNNSLLRKCINFLRSSDCHDNVLGVIISSYIIEQSLKLSLIKKNRLLVYLPKDSELRKVVIGKYENLSIKTNSANRCLELYCEFHPKFTHKSAIEDLFNKRNALIHGIDEATDDYIKAATETSVSCLKNLTSIVTKAAGITDGDINPLTHEEFIEFQKEQQSIRIASLVERLTEHNKIFNSLSDSEVEKKLISQYDSTNMSWVDHTLECPACAQKSLDIIESVDFDWSDGGVWANAGRSVRCRVCELEISEYELDTIINENLSPDGS